MGKRKLPVGFEPITGVAANAQKSAEEAVSSAAAAGVPGFPETEAELERLKAKVQAQIEALVARMPEGFQPSPAQLNQIISVAVANWRNRLMGPVAADLLSLVQTGRGPFKHDPAALA
jgi:hypothetical protein